MHYTKTHIDSLETVAQTAVALGAIPKSALNEILTTLKGSLNQKNESTVERLLSKKEIAKALGVHTLTVHRLIKAQKLKAIHVGSAVRIPESSLNAFISGQ